MVRQHLTSICFLFVTATLVSCATSRTGPKISTNGWGGGNLVEPLTVVEEYSAEWSKPLIELNLQELARLRVQEGFTIKKLADHFGVGTTKIFKELRKSIRAS